ncbi:MAG TPA: hypothetical protein VMV40_01195 [Acidiferrobacter sp.]|nr:hypothetical protein [Acidiferrobacter sp.]
MPDEVPVAAPLVGAAVLLPAAPVVDEGVAGAAVAAGALELAVAAGALEFVALWQPTSPNKTAETNKTFFIVVLESMWKEQALRRALYRALGLGNARYIFCALGQGQGLSALPKDDLKGPLAHFF